MPTLGQQLRSFYRYGLELGRLQKAQLEERLTISPDEVRSLIYLLGSAVVVERIFSGGRNTISLRCASLKPDIRILMLVKRRLIVFFSESFL